MSALGLAGRARSSNRDYWHDGFLYDDDQQLAEIAIPFLLEGLNAGEPAVIATTPRTADVLREGVGDHPRLHVLGQQEAYRSRTPATITTFRGLAEDLAASGHRLRVVGEVDFGATEREWLEWQRYESVVNQALADWPLWGLCVFDTQRLSEPVLDSAVATHPVLVQSGVRTDNPGYVDPADYLRGLTVPEEPLERTPPRLAVPDVSDFAGLRHAVAGELARTGADEDLVEDFRLAVDEMVSNAVRHGRPPVSLRLWTVADRIVCTIGDGGPGWDDPFAGYGPAHGDDLSRGGMGLWLARQLSDHVDISSGPDGTGVRVRLTVRLP